MTERKTFTIIMATDDDGNTVMTRRNDGFNAHELLGLVEFTRHEIIQQLAGQITPDIVRREVVKDKEEADRESLKQRIAELELELRHMAYEYEQKVCRDGHYDEAMAIANKGGTE